MTNFKFIFACVIITGLSVAVARADVASTAYVDAKIVVDTELSVASPNPVQNSVVTNALSGKVDIAQDAETKAKAIVTTDKDGKVAPIHIAEDGTAGAFITGVSVADSGAVTLSRGVEAVMVPTTENDEPIKNVGGAARPVYVNETVATAVTGVSIPVGGQTCAGADCWATIWIE